MTYEYDCYGRMKYSPELHPNQGKTWEQEDLEYLKEFYYKIGALEMSLALERSETSILEKVSRLVRAGEMVAPEKRTRVKRWRYENEH